VPPPAEFGDLYAELVEYERIFGVHVSAGLSGTYNSATVAAADTHGRVVTIDSESVSGTIVLLADAIQRRLERGTTDEEVQAVVERFRRSARFVYTLETLEYLVRGGRIGRARALAAGALNTRPVIQVVGGVNVPVQRVRGRKRSLAELEHQLVEATADRPTLHIGVTHADAESDARELERRLLHVRPSASFDLFAELGPALGSHLGPGAIGVFWFDDDEE
jgi:DegV family protein with EDD domain